MYICVYGETAPEALADAMKDFFEGLSSMLLVSFGKACLRGKRKGSIAGTAYLGLVFAFDLRGRAQDYPRI